MAIQWDVLGVGSSAVDDVLYVERFPLPDEKLPVQTWQRRAGGQTATALVTAARQGARAGFCGCLGDDELSTFTRHELEREGVDCTPVIQRAEARPIHSVVIVDTSSGSHPAVTTSRPPPSGSRPAPTGSRPAPTGRRTILYSSQGALDPPIEAINPAWISASRVIFIDQNHPVAGLHAARLARASQVPVVADIEKVSTPNLKTLLAHIDHLIVNILFARQLTGQSDVMEMVRALARFGNAQTPRPVTVVTWGERGCWYCQGAGEVIHSPAYPVQPVDTTGCGDVFHGAYAAALARGEPIPQAIEIAGASAALKATRLGGRAGIPNLAEARALVQTRHAL